MANFDGTGPQGKGPMTGRGMGNCVVPIKTVGRNTVRGRGLGRVLGKGLARNMTGCTLGGPGYGQGGGRGAGAGRAR